MSSEIKWTLHVPLPLSTYRRLRKEARRSGTSMTKIINKAVSEYLTWEEIVREVEKD